MAAALFAEFWRPANMAANLIRPGAAGIDHYPGLHFSDLSVWNSHIFQPDAADAPAFLLQ